MQHSFSSQSFLKPSHKVRLPQAQHRVQNDITVPKDYFNQRELIEQLSDDSPQKSNQSTRSIQKLRKKIKQIKCALKIAEQHNEQLHIKVNEQKKYFQEQKKFMQIQVSKYKSLYEMLIQNYQARSMELKEARKRVKKLQKQQFRTNSQINIQQYQNMKSPSQLRQQEQNMNDMKQIVTQQQVSLQHMRHENKLLREELVLKNKKILEYQILIQTYQAEQKMNKLSPKHSQQFIRLSSKMQQLQEDNNKLKKDKEIAITKTKRLQVQLQSTKRFKQSIEKDDLKLKKQLQELKLQLILKQRLLNQPKQSQSQLKWKKLYENTSAKHNELLKFSYQIQKDFERELHTMAKQMTRREIVKNSHSHS